MNERIRELVVEAGATLNQDFYQNVIDIKMSPQELEDFVELIVRDGVAAIANDTANYPGEAMMAYYQGVQDAAKGLKRYFGVENECA